MTACFHCGGEVEIRNPKGFCDHLYYPENCQVCLARLRKLVRGREKNHGGRTYEVRRKYQVDY